MVQVITKHGLIQKRLTRRKELLTLDFEQNKVARPAYELMMQSLETGIIPRVQVPEGFNINSFIRSQSASPGVIAEFIGTGDFATQFFARQRYEVDAGRESEPEIFQAIYSVITDSTLPKTVQIYTLGDAGVVFELIPEGGEVRFASINTGSKSVTMQHYTVGLEYSEDLFLYNELFRMANIERQFGVAHSALLNHIHMQPILNHTYPAGNLTDGTALTTFKADASLPEKYLRAVESAIVTAITDTSYPRRGPYIIICSAADLFTLERAFARVPQQGFDIQSTAIGQVQQIVAYDGWSGTRGADVTTYPGVSAGTAYLVNLGNREMDFQSYFKQPLRSQMDQGDLLRFIMARTVWDSRFGVFADPTAAIQKITLPGVGDGEA